MFKHFIGKIILETVIFPIMIVFPFAASGLFWNGQTQTSFMPDFALVSQSEQSFA